MTFNSHGFIFMILPITLIGFYLIRAIGVRRNMAAARVGAALRLWLIAMSLWFLGLFGARNLIILLVSLAFNGVMLYLLQRSHNKILFAFSVIVDVAALALFKYDFGLVFPVAISFYTFEQISILVDTYRGAAGHGKDPMPAVTPLNYILYLVYYPKLIEGPIARYDKLAPQFDALADQRFDSEQFLRGAVLFCIGLGKKALLADVYGAAVDVAFGSVGTLTSLDVILSAFAYTLQLYFDFSGYCDMGEGVSRMLGITLPVNFNSPFRAETPLEFWGRWHATLNDFLTDYVYIPLGGSRVSKWRQYRNIFIVFCISGLWHGNDGSFLLWGAAHGVMGAITRAVNPQPARGVRHGIRVAIVLLWWTFWQSLFRASTLGEWITYLSRLAATRLNLLFVTKDMLDAMIPKELTYILNASPLCNTPWATIVGAWFMMILGLVIILFARNSHEIALEGRLTKGRLVLFGILFIWSVISLTGVSTFLYTNF